MKYSFGISDFLEEISSLSHSVVFLYFFALIAEECFLISSCYSLELCIQMFISFLFSFAFCFSSFHSSANFLCHKHSPHKQVSDNNPSHGLKLRPTCPSWNIFCKDPWTNVNGYIIDYFLGTTAEGFVLSHASLKNSKHLNILSSQLNWRKERASQNHKNLTPSSRDRACGMRRRGWGRASILSVMPNAAPNS